MKSGAFSVFMNKNSARQLCNWRTRFACLLIIIATKIAPDNKRTPSPARQTEFNNKDSSRLIFAFSSPFKNPNMLSQIAEEGFLEFINNILTIGMVPAMFTDDEKDTIIGNCRNAAKEAGYSVSK